ncbi:MAG: alpha/beta hydrolase [Spirochaetales bacterium]|nr:alpha/beta hydrolase [Spirochaetales bacterium]
MKKKFVKRLLLIIAILFVSLIAAAVIIPLFISLSPLENVMSFEEVKKNGSPFVTISFEGTDGIDLHYMEKGGAEEGEPVFILLHGSLYNLYSWDRVIDYFGSIGRVIAYDQVPYGLSEKLLPEDWSGTNPYTQQAAVDQLVALLDAFDFDQVYLVGSSYGGTLAVRTALEHENRVAGMILVDAAVFVYETMPGWLLGSPQMENLGPLFARMMGTNVPFYESCYGDPAFFGGKRKEDTMVLTKVENWDFALWQYLKAWGGETFDFENVLPSIDIPVLVISGSEDAVVPADDSRKLDRLLPDSRLEIITGAGHMPHEENPEEFVDIVSSWFEEIKL